MCQWQVQARLTSQSLNLPYCLGGIVAMRAVTAALALVSDMM